MKPLKIIELISSLKTTTDKDTLTNIHTKIGNETMSTEFEHSQKDLFQGIVFKKLIQQTVKEFINDPNSQESLDNLNILINTLDTTSVISR